jgi:class 3 adenylate cyclase
MGSKINQQNETIEHILVEKEKLLLNILPAPIVERVENGEVGIGDSYDNVTVLFTSLTGFDNAFINESASKSIAWLNELINAFDESAEKFGVEKIKTIGDDYMAACGLSVPRFDHVRRSVDFAIDMLKIIDRFNRDHNVNISLQVGIHSGTVIAGIIGRHKFVYDLWGEVVDISGYIRHEATLNTVLLTETSYQAVDQKEKFKNFGTIHVKGVGDIETWEYNILVDHPQESKEEEEQKSV